MAEKEHIIPDLPQEKDYHIFVCYHHSEENRVRHLVQLLEQEGLKCCYYERDFTAGCSMFDSIKSKIPKSMHMLVILSEELNESGYGIHELELAMHLKITAGYTVIPMMVEQCNVPDCLKYIRYIDAMDRDVTEMPSLIIDAIAKNKIEADYKRMTGTQISVGLTNVKGFPNTFSMSRYKLKFDVTYRQQISAHNFQFTNDELSQIEDIVSHSELVKYWHIFSHFVLTSCLLLFLLLLIYICGYLLLLTTIVEKNEDDSRTTLQALGISLSVLIIKLFVLFLWVLYFEGYKSKDKTFSRYHIQYMIWLRLVTALSRVNKEARDKGRIVMFDYIRGELILMRYDFRICQAGFVKRCEQLESLQVYKKAEESLMEYTNRLFDDYVQSERCWNLNIPAISRKHTLSNGAKCLCLLVEEEICKQI